MKSEINNGVVLDAVETISKHCESITDCGNCILKKYALQFLTENRNQFPIIG